MTYSQPPSWLLLLSILHFLGFAHHSRHRLPWRPGSPTIRHSRLEKPDKRATPRFASIGALPSAQHPVSVNCGAAFVQTQSGTQGLLDRLRQLRSQRRPAQPPLQLRSPDRRNGD